MAQENEEVVVDTTNNEAEGGDGSETISLSKSEYEKMNQTLGSLKRELKDLRKPKDEPKETAQTNQPDNSLLEKLERMALRSAGITHPEDMELARKTAKKWGMDIDEVILDDDFKLKLDRQQSTRANVEATSGIKGNSATSAAKESVDYWRAKGVPPTAADIPNAKIRRKINVEFYKANKGGGMKFYNE